MKTALRACLVTCLLGWAAVAHARDPVPLMNFENIPVSLSTDKRLSDDQVHKAILAAGAAQSWQMLEKGPGRLEATYWKGNKHIVVVTIAYDAEKYSATYLRSVNMKFALTGKPAFNPKVRDGKEAEPTYDSAVQKQREAFAGQPDSPYAKPAAPGVIHPFYEQWLRDLLGGVRQQLKLAESAGR
jgi:hypothetical protein